MHSSSSYVLLSLPSICGFIESMDGSKGNLKPTLCQNKMKLTATVFQIHSSGWWLLHDKKDFLAFKGKIGQDCSPVVEYLPSRVKILGLISQNWKMMDTLGSRCVIISGQLLTAWLDLYTETSQKIRAEHGDAYNAQTTLTEAICYRRKSQYSGRQTVGLVNSGLVGLELAHRLVRNQIKNRGTEPVAKNINIIEIHCKGPAGHYLTDQLCGHHKERMRLRT